MLISEPGADDKQADRSRPASAGVVFLLALVALIVLVLRHDYWNWDTPNPLLFGFLPVGLWWQGVVSLLAALMMWAMVTFAWPQHLEDEATPSEHERRLP